jgi:hypothetical protein
MRAGDIILEQLATYFQVANRAEGKSPATIRWYEQKMPLLKHPRRLNVVAGNVAALGYDPAAALFVN